MKGIRGNPGFLLYGFYSENTWKELFPNNLHLGTPKIKSWNSIKECSWPQNHADIDDWYSNNCADSKGFTHEKWRYFVSDPQILSWMEKSWWWVKSIVDPEKLLSLSLAHRTYFPLRCGPKENGSI